MGLATVAVVLVSDLRHFLDMPDAAPASAKRLGAQLEAIVRAATARPAGRGWTSAVRCIRRPAHRPCVGFVLVLRRAEGEIEWSCESCGDDGIIRGWEGSPTDVSSLDDSHAEGETFALLVTRDVSAVILEVLLLDDACELLVARAEGRSDGVLLVGRTDVFAELLDSVASEANAETNRRRMQLLDEAYTALDEALAIE